MRIILIVCIIGLAILSIYCAARLRGNGIDLPDSMDAVAAFTPSGGEILVMQSRPPADSYLFDLERKRIIWRVPGVASKGVSFSINGDFLVLAEREGNAPRTSLSVLDCRNGSILLRTEVEPTARYNPDSYVARANRRLSVSNDGAWLAIGRDDRTFAVMPVRKQSKRFEAASAGRIGQVLFDTSGRRLAVFSLGLQGASDASSCRIDVFVESGGSWRQDWSVPAASWPGWIRGGMAFETADGIAVRDDESGQIVSLPVAGWREAGAVRDVELSARSWFFPDGLYAAVDLDRRVDLFRIRDRALLLSQSVEGAPGPALLGVGYSGNLARLLLSDGTLATVELCAGRIAKKESLGKPGRSSRSWLHEGATWTPNYEAAIASDGRFLDIHRRGSGHTVHRID